MEKDRQEAIRALEECEDRLDEVLGKCNCGEPLFEHIDGSQKCPACEQF